MIYFLFILFSSLSPKALQLHMVSFTNPLRNFKRTDLSLSRYMAVSRGISVMYGCRFVSFKLSLSLIRFRLVLQV